MKNIPPTPWQCLSEKDGFDDCLVDSHKSFISISNDQVREHIAQCVNACAGMDDPVMEVQRLKNKFAAAMMVTAPALDFTFPYFKSMPQSPLQKAVDEARESGFKIKTDFSNFPAEPSWHELGIVPPVGTECEAYVNHGHWRWARAEILKQNTATECAVHALDLGIVQWSDQFRPIQTEKQKTIKAMFECFDGYFGQPIDKTIEDLCEKIYDQFIADKKEK